VHLLRPRRIGLAQRRSHAQLDDLGGGLHGRVARAVIADGDVGAGLGQVERDHPPDPVRAPDNQDAGALQPHREPCRMAAMAGYANPLYE
jgi:hypothetical protein